MRRLHKRLDTVEQAYAAADGGDWKVIELSNQHAPDVDTTPEGWPVARSQAEADRLTNELEEQGHNVIVLHYPMDMEAPEAYVQGEQVEEIPPAPPVQTEADRE